MASFFRPLTFSERVALACDADRRAVDPHRFQVSTQYAAIMPAATLAGTYRDEQDADLWDADGGQR